MDKDLLKTLLFFMFVLGVFVGVGVVSVAVWAMAKVTA